MERIITEVFCEIETLIKSDEELPPKVKYSIDFCGQGIRLTINTGDDLQAKEHLELLKGVDIPGSFKNISRQLIVYSNSEPLRRINKQANMIINSRILEAVPREDGEKLITQKKSAQEYIERFLNQNGAFLIRKSLIPNLASFKKLAEMPP